MPKKITSNSKTMYKTPDFLRKRELGLKNELGYEDELARKLITSLEFGESKLRACDGGIFNLEFSLDGSILAAACEKKSILLYDSLNKRLIDSVEEAHLNCVNCVRFLDAYTFATGSDDNTVKTWDIRFLKSATRTLRGHSNWVKNIEYSSRENRLITSAFDGGIYSWDLNNFTEQGVVYDRVFLMDGLMRMKLTPDCSKMIMCTTHGYMLIIHNINLETLNSDLQRFKPNIYRLMQESEQNIPIASCSNNLFSPYRKVNRVELISDFPNTAEVISSLQIHPMGWCALTRNINIDDLSEWTSVHDIQERDINEYLTAYKIARLAQRPPTTIRRTSSNNTSNENSNDPTELRQAPMDLWMGFVSNQNIRAQRMLSAASRRGSGIRTTRASITVFNSGILSSEHQQADPMDLIPRNRNLQRDAENRSSPSNLSPTQSNCENENQLEEGACKIIQNLPRLTHYMEEPNAGKGFIKELCFSPDGRIICSPYHAGIRLFAFNVPCNELSMCVPEHPQRLHQIAHFKDYHPEIVVSCKFNPYHCLLVSGCLGGQIVWYHPVF